jgi:hypothetical protein
MLLDILRLETFEENDVETHFRDKRKLRKERLETASVFHVLATSEPVQLVNLACGNFVDCKTFPRYFPHPFSQVYGVDKARFQLADSYHRHHHLSFHQLDLYDESSALQNFLQTKTHWIAIHACRDLAFQILRLWNQWGANGSRLLLVPCCHESRKRLIARCGTTLWKQIKTETKRKYPEGRVYMDFALIELRNRCLQMQSEWFQRRIELDIPSIHNCALLYKK